MGNDNNMKRCMNDKCTQFNEELFNNCELYGVEKDLGMECMDSIIDRGSK